MFCHNCGHEVSEQMKFCPNCGAKQYSPTQSQPLQDENCEQEPNAVISWLKSFFTIIGAILGFFVFLAVLLLVVIIIDSKDEKTTPAASHAIQVPQESLPSTQEPTIAKPSLPKDGWYTENGKKYYYHDGTMCFDIQKIDGTYYYFNDDGTLAVDAEIVYDESMFKTDQNGKIDRAIIGQIGGEWIPGGYRFGNTGSSAVLELGIPAVDCTSLTFHLEAQGKHGAKVNGKWKIYVRHEDEWEFVQDIDFTQPNGNFEINFDTPMSFDAITAHPTVQGNASYVSFFYLENVDCSFQSILNVL